MSSPLFTIIVPIYNAEDFLRRGLDSILNQNFTDFELILINDGSTDQSLEICNIYAKLDTRIKVFTQKNTGVSSARNLGIKNAAGDYITFIDSDDFVGASFLKRFSEVLNKESYDLVISGFTLYYENDTTKNSVKLLKAEDLNKTDSVGQKIARAEMYYLLSGPFAKVFRREIISENKIFFDFNFHFGEDAIFNHTFLQHLTTVQIINSVEYYYVQSERDSLVKRKYPYQKTMDYIKDLTVLRLNTIDRFDIKDESYINFIEKEKTLYTISALESMYVPAYKISTKIRKSIIKTEISQLNLKLLPTSSIHYFILRCVFRLKWVVAIDFLLKQYYVTKKSGQK